MKPLEAFLLTYLLNALWQVPLLFAAAWLATRSIDRDAPALSHRIWVGTLLLQIALPACSFNPLSWLRALTHLIEHNAAQQTATVTVTMTTAQTHAGLHTSPTLLHAAAALYLAVIACFAIRLAIGLYGTMRLRTNATPIARGDHADIHIARLQTLFHVPHAIIASTSELHGPVVLGVLRPTLLLPCSLLPASSLPTEDLEAALAHEFAHIRRHDFAKNLLYHLLSLPIAFHPALWLTDARIAETRERICDALAADAVHSRQRYARSLVRLATLFSERTRSTTLHAIGMFDANSFAHFERRVMNLTQSPTQLRTTRRIAVSALTVALGLGATTSALALHMQIAAQQTTPQATQPTLRLDNHQPAPMVLGVPHTANTAPAQVIVADITPAISSAPAHVKLLTPTTVPPDATATEAQATTSTTQDVHLPVAGDVIAGNLESKVTPTYPQEAKDKHIQGVVILAATIGTDGNISALKLVSGDDLLAKSAWEAVKQWKYKPYLLNGNPVAVDTTITVNFSLAGS